LVSSNEIFTRRLSRYYASALLLIACLALASHLIQRAAGRNIEGMAEIINVSGRQRMLSQRIPSLVAQYELGNPQAKEDLKAAIAQFESEHLRLSRGDLADDSSPNDPHLIQDLYFSGLHPVDAEVRAFINDAKQAASLPANDPALPAISVRLFAEARAPLLDALDRVVAIRQQESDAKFHRLRALQIAILAVMFAALALEAQFIFRPMVRKILEFGGEILRLASTDSLTGVANRRGFLVRANNELVRSRRYSRSLSLLMIDADRFKRINDTYGHAGGDAALVALSHDLQRNLRPSDILGRMGGEEFAVLLPETDRAGAIILAERLRGSIESLQIEHAGRLIALTVSIGIAEVEPDCQTIEDAMHTADRLLYRAKVGGRNRTVSKESAEFAN